jgi:hypothetical protein
MTICNVSDPYSLNPDPDPDMLIRIRIKPVAENESNPDPEPDQDFYDKNLKKCLLENFCIKNIINCMSN